MLIQLRPPSSKSIEKYLLLDAMQFLLSKFWIRQGKIAGQPKGLPSILTQYWTKFAIKNQVQFGIAWLYKSKRNIGDIDYV